MRPEQSMWRRLSVFHPAQQPGHHRRHVTETAVGKSDKTRMEPITQTDGFRAVLGKNQNRN